MSTIVLDSLIDLRRAVARAAAAAMAQDGVGTAQFALMREAQRLGPCPQIALAKATAQDPGGVVRLLDALEQRGWVERRALATDRRQKQIVLTAAGETALAALNVHYDALRARAQLALDADEQLEFERLCRKLIVALADDCAPVGRGPRP